MTKHTMLNKLRSQAGETIGETLVSLLIGALALTMLAGAVSTAGRLVNNSRDNLKEYYSGRDEMTVMSVSGTDTTVSISGTSLQQSHSIELYINSKSIGGREVAAYKIK